MNNAEKYGIPPNSLDSTMTNNVSTALTKQILITKNDNGPKCKQMNDRYREAPEAPK